MQQPPFHHEVKDWPPVYSFKISFVRTFQTTHTVAYFLNYHMQHKVSASETLTCTTNTIDLDSQQFTRFLFTWVRVRVRAQFMLIMLTFFFNLGHLHLDYSTLMRIIQSISFLLLVIVRLCLTNNLDLASMGIIIIE